MTRTNGRCYGNHSTHKKAKLRYLVGSGKASIWLAYRTIENALKAAGL